MAMMPPTMNSSEIMNPIVRAGDLITIDGSSTVYPISQAVVAEFGSTGAFHIQVDVLGVPEPMLTLITEFHLAASMFASSLSRVIPALWTTMSSLP